MSDLNSIIAELEKVENKLRDQIEKLFGGIEETDFSDEYVQLQDVLSKLKEFQKESVLPSEKSPMGKPAPVPAKGGK